MKLRRRTWVGLVMLVLLFGAGGYWWMLSSAKPTLKFEGFEVGKDGQKVAVFGFENSTAFQLHWAVYMARGPIIYRRSDAPEKLDAGPFIQVTPDLSESSMQPGTRAKFRMSAAGTGGGPFQLGAEYFPPIVRATGMWNRLCRSLGVDWYLKPESQIIWSEMVTP
jgi:hypothetical protein